MDAENGGKRSIEILDISNTVVDLSTRLHKHRERFVSISVLSSERSVRGTLCVLHEKRIATAESVLIRGHGVSTMCLIDSYLSLVPHVEKALLRVHISFRCNPARGVQSDTLISSLEILQLSLDLNIASPLCYCSRYNMSQEFTQYSRHVNRKHRRANL